MRNKGHYEFVTWNVNCVGANAVMGKLVWVPEKSERQNNGKQRNRKCKRS